MQPITTKKVVFIYSAVSSPSDRSKCFTLFALPGRPVHSDTNSASPGSILATQQLCAKTKSLTFPPLSIARYSFNQPTGVSMERTEMPNLRNGSKGGIRTWAHLIASPAFIDRKSILKRYVLRFLRKEARLSQGFNVVGSSLQMMGASTEKYIARKRRRSISNLTSSRDSRACTLWPSEDA